MGKYYIGFDAGDTERKGCYVQSGNGMHSRSQLSYFF